MIICGEGCNLAMQHPIATCRPEQRDRCKARRTACAHTTAHVPHRPAIQRLELLQWRCAHTNHLQKLLACKRPGLMSSVCLEPLPRLPLLPTPCRLLAPPPPTPTPANTLQASRPPSAGAPVHMLR